jgi:hypothetical protein
MVTEMSRYEKGIQIAKVALLAAILMLAGVWAFRDAPVHAQLASSQGFAYTHITTATNTIIATGPVEFTVAINGGTTGAVTIYDNTTCATTVVAVIQAATAPVVMPYYMQTKTGLCITTAAATDVTVGVK